jgi:hypothetical protein
LPKSNNVLEIPQQLPPLPVSNNTLEIPQQFDPYAARPELIDAITQQESGGKATATGQKGEVGLMQVMPATAAQYGVTPEQLADPKINRQVGTRYFSDLLKQYKGNEWLALVAYNEGPGNIAKGRFLPQSVKYASSVLDRAGSRLQGLTGGAAGLAGGQPQMQFPPGMGPQQAPQGGQAPPMPPGMGPGNLPGQPPAQQMAQGGQPQMFIPPGFGQQGQGQQPAQQAAAQPPAGPAAARLQQMLAGQGPQLKYGPLGQQPIQADIAGESYDPRMAGQMSQFAAGALGPEGGEEEMAQLSRRTRDMIRRARQFGVDPSNIAALTRRVRAGGLSEDNLSLALKDLKARVPEAGKTAAMARNTAKVIRKYADDLPTNLLGQVSQAVREGKITLQQARNMLKAGVGGLAVGAMGAGGSIPAQPGQFQQPPVTPPGQPDTSQPGWLSRMGSGISNLFEGTAYAEEPPNAASPQATPTPIPQPSGGLPPLPTAQPTQQPAAAATPANYMGMVPKRLTSGTSGTNITLAPPTVPTQFQVEEYSTDKALDQVDNAITAFTAPPAGGQSLEQRMKRGEFQGSLATSEGRRAYFQPQAATEGRTWQALGMDKRIPEDRQVAKVYDKLGPLTASQLHALIGGRIGAWATSSSGMLIQHLPNLEKDPLPRQLEKLRDLRENLLVIKKAQAKYRARGLSGNNLDNAVIQDLGGDPNFDAGGAGDITPPEGYE